MTESILALHKKETGPVCGRAKLKRTNTYPQTERNAILVATAVTT